MTAMPKYAKTLQDDPDDRVPLKSAPVSGMPITLQVTLGEMDLEDAFRVTLPPINVRTGVGGFLEQVFGDDASAQDVIRAGFDLKDNPDLPEMYDAVFAVFEDWRNGRCSLHFFANQGPEVALSDELWRHLKVRGSETVALLDLVIEQRYRPLDYAVEHGYAESKENLLQWLQTHTLLYYLDRDEFKLEIDPKSEADRRLLPIAHRLSESDLIAPSQETRSFEITPEGRQVLANMIEETEMHLDRYQVFEDVLYDAESGSASFGSGRGEDLRAPVYEAEGLDPLRTVFLLLLYDWGLDGYQSDWRESITDGQFYDYALASVVDHQNVDEADLESIIESGFAHVEEREEQSRRLAAQRQAAKGLA